MSDRIKAVVLAAGESKRMNSGRSKVVHRILGREIINYMLDSLSDAGIADSDIIVVAGKNRHEIESAVKRKVHYAVQKEQRGTADALAAAAGLLKDFRGDVLVTVGDNPYVTSEELKNMISFHRENTLKCTLLSARFPADPPPYGRIIRDPSGRVSEIIEAPDADEDQLKIREVNASIYLFDNESVLPLLDEISSDNKKNEFYLTDIVSVIRRKGYPVDAFVTENHFAAMGINTRREIAAAWNKFNGDNIRKFTEEQGVTVFQPETVTIEQGVKIGRDTVIFPSTYIGSGTVIGSGCRIGPFAYLRNVEIGDGEDVSHEKRTGE